MHMSPSQFAWTLVQRLVCSGAFFRAVVQTAPAGCQHRTAFRLLTPLPFISLLFQTHERQAPGFISGRWISKAGQIAAELGAPVRASARVPRLPPDGKSDLPSTNLSLNLSGLSRSGRPTSFLYLTVLRVAFAGAQAEQWRDPIQFIALVRSEAQNYGKSTLALCRPVMALSTHRGVFWCVTQACAVWCSHTTGT